MGSFIVRAPVWDTGVGGADMLVRNKPVGPPRPDAGNRSAGADARHGAAITLRPCTWWKKPSTNLNARLQMQAIQLGGGKVNHLSPEQAKNSRRTTSVPGFLEIQTAGQVGVFACPSRFSKRIGRAGRRP
jgi:hypothetical protein